MWKNIAGLAVVAFDEVRAVFLCKHHCEICIADMNNTYPSLAIVVAVEINKYSKQWVQQSDECQWSVGQKMLPIYSEPTAIMWSHLCSLSICMWHYSYWLIYLSHDQSAWTWQHTSASLINMHGSGYQIAFSGIHPQDLAAHSVVSCIASKDTEHRQDLSTTWTMYFLSIAKNIPPLPWSQRGGIWSTDLDLNISWRLQIW